MSVRRRAHPALVPRRRNDDEALPTQETFIKAVADLLQAAEQFVSGGVSIGPEMAAFSPERAEALQERFIELAYTYASLTQQVFDVTRADLERGAAAMLRG